MRDSYFWKNILDNDIYFHYEYNKKDCKKVYSDLIDIKMDLFEKIIN